VIAQSALRYLVISVFLAVGFGVAIAADRPPDPDNTLYLDLDDGRVVIRMRPDIAPKHVARIKHLVRGGYYDGMVFHRVIAGFMAQTGDPTGTGKSGSGRNLDAEFSRVPQVRGTVSMARGGGKNTADSQFFIVLADTNRSSLDGKYTAWGEVESGMEFVDKIKKGNESRNGSVTDPDKLIRLQVASDADRGAETSAGNDTLEGEEAAATAREFSGVEFRCGALREGSGAAHQSALARLWAHGYLAGHAKAGKALTLSEDGAALPNALRDACAAKPESFLFNIAGETMSKSPPVLSSSTAAFAPGAYTCGDYAAARAGADTAQANFADLWAFAFIQGFKNAAQPGMEIPFSSRAQLIGALSGNCAKNPDIKYLDLAALVAEKVKLK